MMIKVLKLILEKKIVLNKTYVSKNITQCWKSTLPNVLLVFKSHSIILRLSSKIVRINGSGVIAATNYGNALGTLNLEHKIYHVIILDCNYPFILLILRQPFILLFYGESFCKLICF